MFKVVSIFWEDTNSRSSRKSVNTECKEVSWKNSSQNHIIQQQMRNVRICLIFVMFTLRTHSIACGFRFYTHLNLFVPTVHTVWNTVAHISCVDALWRSIPTLYKTWDKITGTSERITAFLTIDVDPLIPGLPSPQRSAKQFSDISSEQSSQSRTVLHFDAGFTRHSPGCGMAKPSDVQFCGE